MLTLPYFNGDWWSVMIQRSQTLASGDASGSFNDLTEVGVKYKLIAKSKPYEGAEGTTIGHSGKVEINNIGPSSTQVSSVNRSWAFFSGSSRTNETSVFAANGEVFPPTVIQYGASQGSRFGYGGQSKTQGGRTWVDDNVYFSGSIQEIRYYAYPISESIFDDYVMNPESIEGQSLTIGEKTSDEILVFRAEAGNELIIADNNVSGGLPPNNYQIYNSIHPKVTGSHVNYITESFVIAPNINSDVESDHYTFQSSYYIRDEQEIPSDRANITEQFEEFYYVDQPVVGIKNRISDKIRLEENQIPGDVLSPLRSIDQNLLPSQSYTRDINYFEAAFSPQNEINDDIVASLGYFNIGEYIGDPRLISQSATTYPDLDKLRDQYFSKYFKNYQVKDYIRLIKFFDNSLFKMIKDFVPARTGVSSGVVIKQHLLERNKYPQPQLSSSLHNLSGSIQIGFISGSEGGVFGTTVYTPTVTGVVGSFIDLLLLVDPPFNSWWEVEATGGNNDFYLRGLRLVNGIERADWIGPFKSIDGVSQQIYDEEVVGPLGPVIIPHTDEKEFYNGELLGTQIQVTDGDVSKNNPYLTDTFNNSNYDIIFFGELEDFVIGTEAGQGSGDDIDFVGGGSPGGAEGDGTTFDPSAGRFGEEDGDGSGGSYAPGPGEVILYYITSSLTGSASTSSLLSGGRSAGTGGGTGGGYGSSY